MRKTNAKLAIKKTKSSSEADPQDTKCITRGARYNRTKSTGHSKITRTATAGSTISTAETVSFPK